MDTDNATSQEPSSEEKMDTSQNGEEPAKEEGIFYPIERYRKLTIRIEVVEPETRKEKKIKQRKTQLKVTPVFQLGATGQTLLNKYLEIECQLRSTDKEERDKSDAKNALEELVYAIRDKLYATYDGFVQEVEKSNLSKQCDEIEDWLYGDGEDQPKSECTLIFCTDSISISWKTKFGLVSNRIFVFRNVSFQFALFKRVSKFSITARLREAELRLLL